MDSAEGKTALHMVHAWSSANGLLLGQVRTPEKTNEITAIPELLDTLMLENCTVTIDAMGCQVKIAKKIRKKKAHYVLALKKNQGTTADEVARYFKFAENCKYLDIPVKMHTTVEKGHGRIERREYIVLTDLSDIPSAKKWPDIAAVVMVRSHRTYRGKTSVEERHYITSLTNEVEIASAIRAHWGVENKLHWSLDMVFNEDRKRDRKDYAGENMATLRRFALTLLRAEKSSKASGPRKRGKATWDVHYLLKVLLAL